MKPRPIVTLAGGVGAARFLDGLARVLPAENIFIIGNTGDDAEIHGLHVSPDLDTVTYTLAALADSHRGWGIQGDTFHCLKGLDNLGSATWFQLGDRDLATHLYRTERLRQGASLAEVTSEITAALGVRACIAPMSNDRVRTQICTPSGELEFQTYFVKRRSRDRVTGIRFEGAPTAKPTPGLIDTIAKAQAIILCPSNPFISIGSILAVPGIREALRANHKRVAAISPIVGGRALKGPAARMMKSMCQQASAAAVARLYADFAGVFVLDEIDRHATAQVEALGIKPLVTNTVMRGARERKSLARAVVREMEIRP